MIFRDLDIGDRFRVRLLGLRDRDYIKIDDRKSRKPLSERRSNAIRLLDNHKVVIGDNAEVVKIEIL